MNTQTLILAMQQNELLKSMALDPFILLKDVQKILVTLFLLFKSAVTKQKYIF